ncbi:hypothetical protein CMUS01_10957 [Colletotrichum musicola]|uniref:Uncharacterized protein n=1 Tax=Colletotrichum musicola TaxID=2175873 RepID=A0A8H6K1V2_9PEZI|nr:hypothetical protein CMUS01_10957 [Colletotrichum musicola]
MPTLLGYTVSTDDIRQYIARSTVCHCDPCLLEGDEGESALSTYCHDIGVRGFAIQSHLRIPPQIGFFSPEPGRTRMWEGFLVGWAVFATAFMYLLVALGSILIICVSDEDSRDFFQVVRRMAWVIPTILGVFAWMMSHLTRFLVGCKHHRTPLQIVEKEKGGLMSPPLWRYGSWKSLRASRAVPSASRFAPSRSSINQASDMSRPATFRA